MRRRSHPRSRRSGSVAQPDPDETERRETYEHERPGRGLRSGGEKGGDGLNVGRARRRRIENVLWRSLVPEAEPARAAAVISLEEAVLGVLTAAFVPAVMEGHVASGRTDPRSLQINDAIRGMEVEGRAQQADKRQIPTENVAAREFARRFGD